MSKKVTFMHRKNYKNPINTTVRIAFLIEDCHHLFQDSLKFPAESVFVVEML